MLYGKSYHKLLAAPLAVLVLCLVFCRSGPESAPAHTPSAPEAGLEFAGVEAAGPGVLALRLVIHAVNPRGEGARVQLAGSRFFVNGVELTGGYTFSAEENYIGAKARLSVPALCRLDLKNLSPPLDGGEANIEVRAVLDIGFTYDGGTRAVAAARGEAAFPRVREPEFVIESITIRQAELINTRLNVKIRIRNPNPFPVALDAFRYELYGGGRFWADGQRTALCVIPGNSETEQNIYLLMNFTNMRREVLDQIISLRSVHYRFTGEADIGTGIDWLPAFTVGFDLRGDSPVIQ